MDEILPKNGLLLNNATLIILLINGILALIINVLLAYLTFQKCTPKVNNYFNAGFISGNVVASAGYMCCSARRLFFTTGNNDATRLECIAESWNILPFMSGLFFSCLNLLLIAVERFYKVLRPYKCNYFNNKKKNKVSGVRAIQAHREAAVTKRIFVLAVFCFIIQALPLTVLLVIHKRSFIYFDRILRFLQNLNLFFTPIVFIFINPCYYQYLRQILLKYCNLCSCCDFIGI
ncbi:hypothetical protein T11_1036 [Trichinella zimbabwensis]|uniref:G-protein coupled receptors family 1 profile domain-containing protein n=1 Tax=Trichinella zimbabwensis TaxID=268475 RepID=A0A0V1I740_9BILA|nr:hypothetical protein T11_1036 [Trichinella zimbabwensis]